LAASRAAAAASSCCWFPLGLLAVGASAATVGAAASTLAAYRPAFIVLAAGLLGVAACLVAGVLVLALLELRGAAQEKRAKVEARDLERALFSSHLADLESGTPDEARIRQSLSHAAAALELAREWGRSLAKAAG
jgi:hypothetical protein